MVRAGATLRDVGRAVPGANPPTSLNVGVGRATLSVGRGPGRRRPLTEARLAAPGLPGARALLDEANADVKDVI